VTACGACFLTRHARWLDGWLLFKRKVRAIAGHGLLAKGQASGGEVRDEGDGMRDFFRAAVQNIASHGDTDIFPFPLENHVFHDKEDEAVRLLERVHGNFANFLQAASLLYENNLATVGYTGFRWATQIDPLWNAYLLGLVISLGDDIERARIPVSKNVVFTYRFKYDDIAKTLFDPDLGWREFQAASHDYAAKHSHVLICDIADFYPRVYHHRLENALEVIAKSASPNAAETVDRIMAVLSRLSDGMSFGLPVGGPAARLLSELLLNRTDRLFSTNGITFCRFADDYHVFAHSRGEAYAHLVSISQTLLKNEGLSLQKSKTRVMTSEEFLSQAAATEFREPLEPGHLDAQRLLSLNLRYDPYSPTAAQDYEALKTELAKFDIVGMLAREMSKSRLHQALGRRLVSAVKYLSPDVRGGAVRSLVDNFALLYPIFPQVMILVKDVLPGLDQGTREYALQKTRDLIRTGSHITQVAVNLGFAVRVLSEDKTEDADELLARVYKDTESAMLRRDVILAMARRNADYWVSDVRKTFHALNAWEKRSLIVASFMLGDEGKHWRNKIKKGLSPLDELVHDWASGKTALPGWSIPI
jgi:hypothetical protein